MGNIISSIYNYFYPPVTSNRDFKARVNRELNEWITSQYANNSYLAKIPQERINLKREEIERRLSKNTFRRLSTFF
jgi:hypothetical protein